MKTAYTALIAPLATVCLLAAAPALAQVQPLIAWWIDAGDTDSTGLGLSIASIGDINGDDLADFAVTAGTGLANPDHYDQIFIYQGSMQPDTMPVLFFHCPDTGMVQFGLGLFNVGDVNGDGSPDFIAGAEPDTISAQWRKAYLYQGGVQFDTIPYMTFTGPTGNGTHFAWGGSTLGDINGDEYSDFAILDPYYPVSGAPNMQLGAIYIYYGGPNLHSTPDLVIHANSTLNRIGWQIAPLGDINSDGYDDWVMSDQECDGPNGEYHAGVVAIYYGGTPPDTVPHTLIYGSIPGASLGYGLTTLDWNGDGQLDIFAWNDCFYTPDYHGSVWEYNVSTTMNGQQDHVFLGEIGYGANIGHVLTHADLNGDGNQDLISGNPGYTLCGKILAFLNGAGADTIFDIYYFQGNFLQGLGGVVANLGDIDGDHIEDIATSEPSYGGYGRLHVIKGSDSLHQSGVIPLSPSAVPATAALMETYPNPFNATTTFKLHLPFNSRVKVEVYDLAGRKVVTLVDGLQTIGDHVYTWNAQPLASGLYFVQMQAGGFSAVRKVVLLK